MKIFAVPHHRLLNERPLDGEGVLLKQSMLDQGVWFQTRHGVFNDDNTMGANVRLERLDYSGSFRLALEALQDVVPPVLTDYFGVVSLRWDSAFRCLVTQKYMWLGIFRGKECVVLYKQDETGSVVVSFLHIFPKAPDDKAVWRDRFRQDIWDFLKKKNDDDPKNEQKLIQAHGQLALV